MVKCMAGCHRCCFCETCHHRSKERGGSCAFPLKPFHLPTKLILPSLPECTLHSILYSVGGRIDFSITTGFAGAVVCSAQRRDNTTLVSPTGNDCGKNKQVHIEDDETWKSVFCRAVKYFLHSWCIVALLEPVGLTAQRFFSICLCNKPLWKIVLS